MNKANIVMLIALLGLSLSSCNLNEWGSESSSSVSENPTLSIASSEAESSEATSSDSSLATQPSSKDRPPFKISSQSDYYTVSIYQVYWVSSKETYANPRFDFSVTVEAGQPLYSTTDERHALLNQCNVVYNPSGGAYSVNGFYSDEACKHIINGSYYPINHDMNAYYYCQG